MIGKLVNVGRVNFGAVYQHGICSNAFVCGLLKVGATFPCHLILTDTVAGQEHGQLLFLLPVVLGLCWITLLWLQWADHIVGEWAQCGWVQTDLLGESISYNHSGKRSIIADIDLMHRENQKGRNKNRMENTALPLRTRKCACKKILWRIVWWVWALQLRQFPPLIVFCLWFLRAHYFII